MNGLYLTLDVRDKGQNPVLVLCSNSDYSDNYIVQKDKEKDLTATERSHWIGLNFSNIYQHILINVLQ